MIQKTFLLLFVALLPFASAAAQDNNRFVDVIVALDVEHRSQGRAENIGMATAVAQDHGVRASRTYGTVFSGFAARVPEARLAALRNDPLVASVSFDQPVSTMQSCNSPNTPPCDGGGDGGGDTGSSQTVPWGIERIGATLNANTGTGTRVYIIDTGIDATHPDLQANLGNGFAAVACTDGNGNPRNRRICDNSWDDDNGHGTHVAGTVGAIDNDAQVVGVAPGVTLHAVKVLDSGGSGTFAGIIEGVDWVAAEAAALNQAVVANMSLGGGGSKTGSCDNGTFTGDDNLHRAICQATGLGVVFVVAAGNSGADAAGAVPAAYDDAVISVSATNSSDDWASFSNWGDASASWTANASAPVAIAAPGVSILSTWFDGGTNTISGTSMSSPHVAGGAALFMTSNNQSANFSAFANTRAGLLSTAEDASGFSNTTGDPHAEDFLDASAL
ncbi:MAG: S8 family serine peptidase [Wenzhouxiangellaceae bacterium]|nr:S8 family serine peptidase [Wenzhouxiangellaceae bacterium]